ncbi:MAG: TRAP transporter large permease subunit [Candidatus Omnitrophota bacterium]
MRNERNGGGSAAIRSFYCLLLLEVPTAFALGLPAIAAIFAFGLGDPVHFGIVLTVSLAIGQITPPVGVNQFAASTFSRIDGGRLSKAVLPFLAAEIVALIFTTFIPSLSLWLPDWMLGK